MPQLTQSCPAMQILPVSRVDLLMLAKLNVQFFLFLIYGDIFKFAFNLGIMLGSYVGSLLGYLIQLQLIDID